MLWMDVDAALAEVPVNVAPLTDDADFKTIETGVAYNASGMALYWHFVTTAGAYSCTQVTPTTGGAYDWAHQGQGMYSIEIPASAGASINNDTEGFGWFTGVATGVLPWRGPTIGFRAAALNNALIDGGDNLDVNATEMADGLITAAKIAADALTSAKFADGALTANKLADNALTAAKIAADALTSAKIADGAITANKIADNALTAAKFAAGAFAAVWEVLTASLSTAGTIGKLIVDNLNATISSRLATSSYTAPDNATIASNAAGIASNAAGIAANAAAIANNGTAIGANNTAIAAVHAKTTNLPAQPAAIGSAMTLTSGEREAVAAALLDLADGVETSRTVRKALRVILASAAGKLSGAATTTATIRDTNDSKNRIVATVDADGNRTAVTIDDS